MISMYSVAAQLRGLKDDKRDRARITPPTKPIAKPNTATCTVTPVAARKTSRLF